eukprot:COSAG06_NODE_65593_length_256_cov_1.305732_1_plen_38_part_10
MLDTSAIYFAVLLLLLLLLRNRRALGEMARKSNPGDAF